MVFYIASSILYLLSSVLYLFTSTFYLLSFIFYHRSSIFYLIFSPICHPLHSSSIFYHLSSIFNSQSSILQLARQPSNPSFPPRSLVSPKRWFGAEVGVGMLRGRGTTWPHSQTHSYIAKEPHSTEPHSHIATKGSTNGGRPTVTTPLRRRPEAASLHGYVAMWLCGYVALCLCSYVAIWLFGYVDM